MHDIASQLVMKWARMGPSYKIPVTKDFTRLTLDTIALCAMDFRFNSFYQDDMHPFVDAMTRVLKNRSQANQISGIFKRMAPSYKAGLDKDSEYQRQLAEELVRERRHNPTDKKDLLNAMIHGKDPKTGKTMNDGLIAANMVTFLIAGTLLTTLFP
jgi:cytochrome P450 / NADPH-cytochrome P450 reductase